MRRVVLESPYAGDIEKNTAYARLALRDCLERGDAPIASHLLYTQPGVLSDNIPQEREQGIKAGLEWMSAAEAVVVYQDLGLSPGMLAAISHAEWLRIPVEYRRLRGVANNNKNTCGAV